LQEIFTIKEVIAYETDKEWKPAQVKENIIQNSIYGVDIEKGAVDIARLRFWLSLVVDEEKPKALPNLDYKIVVGNSLVSKFEDEILTINWKLAIGSALKDNNNTLYDEYIRIINLLPKKQKQYFNFKADKTTLNTEIRNLKIDLLIIMLKIEIIKLRESGIQPELESNKQKKVQAEERKLKIQFNNSTIKKLENLKKHPEKVLNYFDWQLDFPEVLNPALTQTNDGEKNNSDIENANTQILILNKQIIAINQYLKQQNINEHILTLQTNIVHSQIALIKEQLEQIEKRIAQIYGELFKVEKNIIKEPSLSFVYSIRPINQGIKEINQKVEKINPKLPKTKENNSSLGFDIVIGNPPYGAKMAEADKKYCQSRYITAKTISGVQKGSSDTYTLFIDLGFHICKVNSNLHYIVPISITSSDSLTGVHKLLEENCETIKLSSYSVRPQPVFENAVVNTSILFFHKTHSKYKEIFSTKMYRKNNNFNLLHLVDNLEFIEISKYKLIGRYPKISLDIERNILDKLFRLKFSLGSLIKKTGSEIYFRFAGGRYFKVITNYPTGSSAERSICLAKKTANSVGAILSSNLFFWFYQIYSDNLNMKNYEIESFKIPVDKLDENTITKLENLYSEYLIDIEKNANIRKVSKNSSYNVDTFKEYKIGKSKHIIDKIDDIICPLYGFTEEETEFIKNYEIEFRIREDE